MARKSKSRKTPPQRRTAAQTASAPQSERDKIVAAFLKLLAEKRIEQIGFAEIADEAGVPLADLRDMFASPIGMLAAHMKSVDRAVLSGDFADMEEEPARERLFDVLMRRLEVMAAQREAVRS